MRKLFTTLALAALTLTASATDYTEKVRVSLDGLNVYKGTTTFSVTPENENLGTYTFKLENFAMGDDAFVGTIVLPGVTSKKFSDGTMKVATDQTIQIEEGTIPGKTWIGAMLPPVPIKLDGRIKDGKFYSYLTIDMTDTGTGFITVELGKNDYQIGNSDFEIFHDAEYGKATSSEPDFWHSFMSCDGNYKWAVAGTPHTFISDVEDGGEVRPGSTGKRSLRLTSGLALGITPANGTITTGRMHAGDTSAKSSKNHAYLDLSKAETDLDAIGDPFNAEISAQPDSIEVWVKFKQGKLSSNDEKYKYATINAVITDGSNYQDPEDKTYTNVVAKATNAQIESKDFTWQRIAVPFDYESYKGNNAATKAILVTISTNAEPGKGSRDANNPDEMFIDDLSLVYNSQLESLTVGGKEVTGFSKDTYEYNIENAGAVTADDIVAKADGRQALVDKKVEQVSGGYKATVSVTAADYSVTHTYTVNIKDTASGINGTTAETDNAPVAIYNAAGQRVSAAAKGLNIVKKANGEVKKVLNK